jgi:hypothetical protein
MFKTDIITERTPHHGDMSGAYAAHYATIDRRGLAMVRLASAPGRFAPALAKALDERGPFARHAVGWDAHMLQLANRFLPGRILHQVIRLAMGLPRQGALRGRPVPESTVASSSDAREQYG